MENPAFEKVLAEMLEIHNKKNSNYAHGDDPYSNFRGCERFGIEAWRGILVRMSDKWERIQNLANGAADAVGESIQDTLIDLAVYSILAKLMFEEFWEQVAGDEVIYGHNLVTKLGPESGEIVRELEPQW